MMSMADKILQRKRALIETFNDELKNIALIEYSIQQSFNNFIVNVLSAIVAYCFLRKSDIVAAERMLFQSKMLKLKTPRRIGFIA